jgi:preprotein translocase subunit SecA
MLSQRKRGGDLPKGLDAAWDSALGIAGRAVPRRRRFLRLAQKVLDLEPNYVNLGSSKLREAADRLRETFRRGRQTPDDLLHGFAVVREVAARELGERPYLVQVAGAMAIEAGCVAEMATGEGKTLTATMPATIDGWKGKGCHVITANDYLASRDAEWMNKVYSFCGLHADYVMGDMKPDRRRQAYQADITYCTNKEVAADFLRDRLALGQLRGLPAALLAKIAEGAGRGTDRLVQRGLHYAIIDEADSILIDEAVTPLIISGDAPNPEQVDAFTQASDLVTGMQEGEHYTANHRYREIRLTNKGKRELDKRAESLGGIWAGARRREELAVQALTARHFYQIEKQYVIMDGKIVIVDEFTGRLMPDRTWRDGLHQAIEAKEELEVQPPKDTFARISFQRFFRLYERLSGMTGTAREASREFWQIYHTPVVVIPTNKPCIRQMRPDRVFATEKAKWRAIVEEIRRQHESGRPVLVGTRSVRASEILDRLLTDRGLDHQVLNAVRHKEEAQIVAGAGIAGRITVATNMAGRGTDIKLGGGVREAGGLHVIMSERHESGRIDRQLVGRAARQGDPGSGQAIVSLEDELLQRHAPHSSAALRRRYGKSDREITNPVTRRLFDSAQKRATKMALRQRKAVLRTDDWLDEYLGFAGSES